MDETLRQLGELLLQSIPTVILFAVVYFAYRIIVHKPLMRVLEERYAKTQGAIEKSRADIAAAQAKTAEYEQRLREAKLAVFRAQEARLHLAATARAELLNRAREQANTKVAAARISIDEEVKLAKTSLQSEAERLASEVIATVLRPVAMAQTPAGGAH